MESSTTDRDDILAIVYLVEVFDVGGSENVFLFVGVDAVAQSAKDVVAPSVEPLHRSDAG